MRLEALRGSERRVQRIVGMVGLTLDETPLVLVIPAVSIVTVPVEQKC